MISSDEILFGPCRRKKWQRYYTSCFLFSYSKLTQDVWSFMASLSVSEWIRRFEVKIFHQALTPNISHSFHFPAFLFPAVSFLDKYFEITNYWNECFCFILFFFGLRMLFINRKSSFRTSRYFAIQVQVVLQFC